MICLSRSIKKQADFVTFTDIGDEGHADDSQTTPRKGHRTKLDKPHHAEVGTACRFKLWSKSTYLLLCC